MSLRFAAALVLVLAAASCRATTYEYEHEFWIRVDGTGSVYVTGRPELWSAFKGLPRGGEPEELKAAARALFERSGLNVRRVTMPRRRGRSYLFVSARFDDVNRLAGTPAFPDVELSLRREGERLRLQGAWVPAARPSPAADGLVAMRFHLPSRVYEHHNAFAGVERGNIVAWRQELARVGPGVRLPVGAVMDRRSILSTTVTVFAASVILALALLAVLLYVVLRRGRRVVAADPALPARR